VPLKRKGCVELRIELVVESGLLPTALAPVHIVSVLAVLLPEIPPPPPPLNVQVNPVQETPAPVKVNGPEIPLILVDGD